MTENNAIEPLYMKRSIQRCIQFCHKTKESEEIIYYFARDDDYLVEIKHTYCIIIKERLAHLNLS